MFEALTKTSSFFFLPVSKINKSILVKLLNTLKYLLKKNLLSSRVLQGNPWKTSFFKGFSRKTSFFSRVFSRKLLFSRALQ